MASSNENQATHQCANPACSCNVPAEKEYCSEQCAGLKQMDGCQCGHSECEAHTEQAR